MKVGDLCVYTRGRKSIYVEVSIWLHGLKNLKENARVKEKISLRNKYLNL